MPGVTCSVFTDGRGEVPRKATVRARGLGAELRDLRNRVGLPMTKVGDQMGWSVATVSRIETGQRGVSSEEVAALLVVYKVAPDERERLLALAREADQPGWWETGDPRLPRQLTTLIRFEAETTRITDVSTILVPGLLQTPAYSREVMRAAGIPDADAETRVVTRQGRQAVLRGANPPHLTVFLDEAAVRRPIGDRSVMVEQMHRLVEEGRRENVSLRVLPFACGGHAALAGSFAVLEFAKAATIVHFEHKRAGLFLDRREDVDSFLYALNRLEGIALDPAGSLEFLANTARTY